MQRHLRSGLWRSSDTMPCNAVSLSLVEKFERAQEAAELLRMASSLCPRPPTPPLALGSVDASSVDPKRDRPKLMCGRRTTGTIKCPRCRCPPKAEMAWLLSLFSLSSSGANQSSPGHQILTPPMAHRENKIIAVAHIP